MVFRDWLDGQMEQRGIGRRELARRLAAQSGTSFDSYRRSVKRYLAGETVPNEQTRDAIAEALGVNPSEMPSPDDEEDDLFAGLMLEVLKLREKFALLEPRPVEVDRSHARMMASLRKYEEPSYQRMQAALRKYEAAA